MDIHHRFTSGLWMATRLFICTVLAVLAGGALIIVTIRSADVRAAEVVAGFAIEAIGILVTVGFVDLLLERDRRRDRAKTLAWKVIYDADHAVWVWQGGSRRLNLSESVGLVDLIDDSDPRPIPTENLLLQLGDACQLILESRDPAVTMDSEFLAGFESLRNLSYFRDSPLSPVPNHEIQRYLRDGVKGLLQGLGIRIHPSSMSDARNFENLRDPSENGQRFRLTGERAKQSIA